MINMLFFLVVVVAGMSTAGNSRKAKEIARLKKEKTAIVEKCGEHWLKEPILEEEKNSQK